MTTLADMTPEQQADCVGMWCEAGEHLRVIRAVYETPMGMCAKIIDPAAGRMENYTSADHITPRLDLPRAWQADGTPVVMDVEGADYRPGTNRGFYILDETIQKGRELPEGTTRAHRFVGEWEEA